MSRFHYPKIAWSLRFFRIIYQINVRIISRTLFLSTLLFSNLLSVQRRILRRMYLVGFNSLFVVALMFYSIWLLNFHFDVMGLWHQRIRLENTFRKRFGCFIICVRLAHEFLELRMNFSKICHLIMSNLNCHIQCVCIIKSNMFILPRSILSLVHWICFQETKRADSQQKLENYGVKGKIYRVYMCKWSLISVAIRISWCRHVFVLRLTSATERFINAFGRKILTRALECYQTHTACSINKILCVSPPYAEQQRPRPTHLYQCFERFHMFTVDSLARFVVILMLGIENNRLTKRLSHMICRNVHPVSPTFHHSLSVSRHISSMWFDSFIETRWNMKTKHEQKSAWGTFWWRIRYPHADFVQFKCDFSGVRSLSFRYSILSFTPMFWAIHTVRIVKRTCKVFHIYCVDSQRISLVHRSHWFEHIVRKTTQPLIILNNIAENRKSLLNPNNTREW